MPANLVVARVSVRSFRCLGNVEMTLEPGTTVLVGENNSGKSSFLLALATALSKRRSSTDDLRREPDGSVARSASVDVFLSPLPGDLTFTDELRQRLISVQREPGTNRETLGIRTTLQRSSEGSLLIEKRHFLQPSTDGAWIESPAPSFQPRVLELFEAHLMDASRDLLDEMGTQTSSWGRVLSDLKIPDLPDLSDGQLNPLGRKALEKALKHVSDQLREASPVLKQLQSDLGEMANTQATVGNVNLLPLPLRIDELAKTIEVILHQLDSAELPLRFHGLGSRSLAALLVFRTMCLLKVGHDQGIRPHLLTLLEEPEAHLHPHAVTALISTINGLPGQRIVATHSTTLVAEVEPTSVRLLRRTRAGIEVTSMPPNSSRSMERFRRFFGRPFGELFFARLVIFGDGIAERDALPVLVGMAIGVNPVGLGVTFVDSESMNDHTRLNSILKTLHHLKIPWLCYPDNDEAGIQHLARLIDPATGSALSAEHQAVVVLSGTKQIEQLLIDAGFGDEISQVASESGQSASTDEARLRFLNSQKGWAARAVAMKAKEAGKSAPSQLSPLIMAICRVLERTAPVACATPA